MWKYGKLKPLGAQSPWISLLKDPPKKACSQANFFSTSSKTGWEGLGTPSVKNAVKVREYNYST